jgi:hypothetical protein
MNIPARICGATTTAGTPCRRACAPGLTRCNLHGGKSPQAIAAAQRYLAFGRDLAAEFLYNLIEQAMQDRCEVCGRGGGDPSPVIRAATVVLDRAGLPPVARVQHSLNPAGYVNEELAGLSNAQLAEMCHALAYAYLALDQTPKGEPSAGGCDLHLLPAIDAEVVPTPPSND